MIVLEITGNVRAEIGDVTLGAQQWLDSEIIPHLNNARRALFGKVPAAFAVSSIVADMPADLTANGDTVDFDVLWKQEIMWFTAASVLREDESPSEIRLAKLQELERKWEASF